MALPRADQRRSAAQEGKVSFNDLIVKALALALRRVPECNASWARRGDRHPRPRRTSASPSPSHDGLITPVVRDADRKGIGAIAARGHATSPSARAGQEAQAPTSITGSTFTVSNLGMFGIDEFTAIINPPEAGILAVGAVESVPVVEDGDRSSSGQRMTVTMSCDHRVIDGALGAQWLAASSS